MIKKVLSYCSVNAFLSSFVVVLCAASAATAASTTPLCALVPSFGATSDADDVDRVTIAGSEPGLQNNADGDPLSALFYGPVGVAVHPISGSVFVVDRGNRVLRRISTDGNTETFAGNGQEIPLDSANPLEASFSAPFGVALNPIDRQLYLTDDVARVVRQIDLSPDGSKGGSVTTIAGAGGSGAADGPALSATFHSPQGVCYNVFDGSLYIADTGNSVLRKLNRLTNDVSSVTTPTPAGPEFEAKEVWDCAADEVTGEVFATIRLYHGLMGVRQGESARFVAGDGTPGLNDATGTTAQFALPTALAGDWTNRVLYIADTENIAIRAMDLATFVVSTVWGGENVNDDEVEILAMGIAGLGFDSAAGGLVLSIGGEKLNTINALRGLGKPCAEHSAAPTGTSSPEGSPPPTTANGDARRPAGIFVAFQTASTDSVRFVSVSGGASTPTGSPTVLAGSAGLLQETRGLAGNGQLFRLSWNGTVEAAVRVWRGAGSAAGLLSGAVTGLSQERDGVVYFVSAGAPGVYRYTVGTGAVARMVGDSMTNAAVAGVGPAGTVFIGARQVFSLSVAADHSAVYMVGGLGQGGSDIPALFSRIVLPQGARTAPDGAEHVPLSGVRVPLPSMLAHYRSDASGREYLVVGSWSALVPIWRVALDTLDVAPVGIERFPPSLAVLLTAVAWEGAGMRWGYAGCATADDAVVGLSWNAEVTRVRVQRVLEPQRTTNRLTTSGLQLPVLTSLTKTTDGAYLGAVGLEVGGLRSVAIEFVPLATEPVPGWVLSSEAPDLQPQASSGFNLTALGQQARGARTAAGSRDQQHGDSSSPPLRRAATASALGIAALLLMSTI